MPLELVYAVTFVTIIGLAAWAIVKKGSASDVWLDDDDDEPPGAPA